MVNSFLGFASFLQQRSFTGASYSGSNFFLFLYHYCQIHIILITTTPFVWAVHETLLPEAKCKLTVFPKGKQQKNHLSLHSFPHQGFLLTEWGLSLRLFGNWQFRRINGELHFWWMNHLKIPWHSSHDLFWRQINSLPKVAFYFMFKKPSQPRYMRNSKSCWDLSQCEKGRKDGATESHFQERSDLQTWALKGSEPKRMPKNLRTFSITLKMKMTSKRAFSLC